MQSSPAGSARATYVSFVPAYSPRSDLRQDGKTSCSTATCALSARHRSSSLRPLPAFTFALTPPNPKPCKPKMSHGPPDWFTIADYAFGEPGDGSTSHGDTVAGLPPGQRLPPWTWDSTEIFTRAVRVIQQSLCSGSERQRLPPLSSGSRLLRPSALLEGARRPPTQLHYSSCILSMVRRLDAGSNRCARLGASETTKRTACPGKGLGGSEMAPAATTKEGKAFGSASTFCPRVPSVRLELLPLVAQPPVHAIITQTQFLVLRVLEAVTSGSSG
jgi:hypothetical protein